MRSLLVVAKPVSWTLDPDRPRKTGSRYNDTLSCFGKPKGSVTMSQKVTDSLTPLLTWLFWLNLHWGVFLPPSPLPGQGLITPERQPACVSLLARVVLNVNGHLWVY